MRIDILLSKLCLVKSRTVAKNACDRNLVKVNDVEAKASLIPNPGDKVEISIYGYKTVIEITNIPQGNVSKKSAPEYYRLLSREKITDSAIN
jgi:ribosomal 50S subunit-recycling heat shock protein